LQIVDGYCTRLLPVSCVGTGIKKNFRMILFFQEPFTLITVKWGTQEKQTWGDADGGNGVVNPGGHRGDLRGRILSPMRISALRSSCVYAFVMASPSCC